MLNKNYYFSIIMNTALYNNYSFDEFKKLRFLKSNDRNSYGELFKVTNTVN